MSDDVDIDIEERACEACGRTAPTGDRRCRVCGFGLGPAWSLVGAVPAAFIAAGVAASGAPLPAWIAGNVPAHIGSPGFLESSWQLGRSFFVLGCTAALPYMYPAVAGGAASLARQVASTRTASVAAVGATLGAAGALALTTQSLSLQELGFRALACLLAALLAGPIARWLNRPWMQALGRATRHRPLATTLLAVPIAHGFVLALVTAFGVTLLAIWLMCLVATAYAIIRGVWHAMFGSTSGRRGYSHRNLDGSRTDVETQDGEEVRSVQHKQGIFGDDSKVERDGAGNIVSVSTLKKPFFGAPYWERRDADGGLMSTSRVEKDWITGEEKTVLRGPRGEMLAEQRVETPVFGGEGALVTRDADRDVVAKQQVRQELLGGPVVVTEDASGKVVATTRVETPILGPESVVREGASVDSLLEQRRREKEGDGNE